MFHAQIKISSILYLVSAIFIVMLDIKNEPLELNHTAKPLYFLFFPLNGCIQSTLCILKRKETIGKNQLKIYFMVMGFGNYVNKKTTRDDLWSKKVHNGGRNIFSSVVIKHSSCRQNRRIQWPLLYNSLSQISSYFVLPCSSKSAYKVDFNGPVVGTWQLLKCISLDGWDFPSSSQFVSEGFNRCDNLKL